MKNSEPIEGQSVDELRRMRDQGCDALEELEATMEAGGVH